jgi:hypothetical protein
MAEIMSSGHKPGKLPTRVDLKKVVANFPNISAALRKLSMIGLE